MISECENRKNQFEKNRSLDYTVCSSWVKIFVSWSKFCLVLKHWRICFNWLGKATAKVWLFLYFYVFPSVIPSLQLGSYYAGFEILVGFKNLVVFV